MAVKLSGQYVTGASNIKGVRTRDSDGAFWSTVGVAFEAYNASNIANYGIAAAETGATGIYMFTDPADTTAGRFRLVAAAGASLVVSDLANNVFWEDVAGGIQDIQSRLPAALTGAGNIKADSLAISGDSTAADNAESFFDGTGYAGTNNVIPTVTLVNTLTTYTGNTPQTGDAYGLLTTAVADSIPADGTRPSPVQALYMLTQGFFEGSISGTTWTIKKVDGTTTLFTVTLNDATTPTSKTRAT